MNNESPNTDALYDLFEIISLRRTQIIVAFLIVFGITIIGVILMPPIYTANSTVFVGLPMIPKGDMPYLRDLQGGPTFVANQLAFVRSRSVYEKAATDLRITENIIMKSSLLGKLKRMLSRKNVDPFEKALDFLYSSTSAQIRKGTDILEITATAQSAETAADIANAIATSYTDYANNLLSSKSKDAYEFIGERLDEAKKGSLVAQNRLLDFMKNKNVASIESIRLERNNLQNELTGLKLKYEQLESAGQGGGNQGIKESMDDPSQKYQIQASDTPRVKDIKSRLQNLNRELRTLLRDYTENHPQVIALKDKIDKEKEELSQETGAINLENTRGGTPKSRRAYLLKQINTVQGEIAKLAQNEIELTKFVRDSDIKQAELIKLQQQFESASTLNASQLGGGSIRIVDRAYPSTGANNKKKTILLLVGFAAALLFGLGSAFVAEYYDDSLNSSEEAERYLKIHVLGSIPPITSKKQ